MDDGTLRPELPDPQRDRHVAFPDLGPASPTESIGEASASTPSSPAPGLPPDAWADHTSSSSPSPASGWQPAPSVPHAPAARRRRPAWLPFAAIIGIFVVMGNAGDVEVVVDAGDGYSSQEWGGSPDPLGDPAPEPAQVGWISSAADPATVKAPISAGTAVSPVPADTRVLRVEVTAPSPEDVLTQISTGAGLYEEIPESTPVLRDVHPGPASRSLDITVSSATESSAELQCRVYADETLVALDTSTTGRVACTVSW